MKKDQESRVPPGSAYVGVAIIGLVGVGIVSALAAIVSLIDHGDSQGAGMLAIASALSFGFLLNGFVRR